MQVTRNTYQNARNALVGKSYLDHYRRLTTVIAVDGESALVSVDGVTGGLRVVGTGILKSVLEIQSGVLAGRYLDGLTRRIGVTRKYHKVADSTQFEEV